MLILGVKIRKYIKNYVLVVVKKKVENTENTYDIFRSVKYNEI